MLPHSEMKSSFSTYWRDLANGKRKHVLDRLLLGLLIPLSLPYAFVQRLRAGLYRGGIFRSHTLPRPVVSIGNITVGGTGKTPVTAFVARLLQAEGLKVAVLSRGYGGTKEGTAAIVSDGSRLLLTAEECGDEPYLLASTVPGLMVAIGSSRHSAGLLAMDELSPDIFLLDDGFQHLQLQRDLNILLVDARSPFGNGWCLPAGLLREPFAGTGRADFIIRTRCHSEYMPDTSVPGIPFCNARHDLGDAVPLQGGEPITLDTLRNKRIIAFAGIAEPQAFFDGLRAQGLNLVATRCLPDHAAYGPSILGEITETINACNADYAVTTEKDGVKLRHLSGEHAQKIMLARLKLSIDNPAQLITALRNLLQK